MQLMLKQSALTGAAKAQDPTDVNRGDVHPKTALSLDKGLHEPFPPQLIAEQVQRNGINPTAYCIVVAKLMQILPSTGPGCL